MVDWQESGLPFLPKINASYTSIRKKTHIQFTETIAKSIDLREKKNSTEAIYASTVWLNSYLQYINLVQTNKFIIFIVYFK